MKSRFGWCRMCLRWLGEEEYFLGIGRCKSCARKSEEGVGFGTIYGNIEGEKVRFIDNSI